VKNKIPVILASSSPRRREMLKELGLDFECVTPDVPETALPGETPDELVQRLALLKARAVLTNAITPCLIIAGDTAVVLGERILGKPEDHEDARHMLHSLSGQTHYVITGLSLLRTDTAKPTSETTFSVKTYVTFKSLTSDEINAYVQTGDPMDKAGAYGIQSGAGSMIESINGSYTNVVGLPMEKLIEELKK